MKKIKLLYFLILILPILFFIDVDTKKKKIIWRKRAVEAIKQVPLLKNQIDTLNRTVKNQNKIITQKNDSIQILENHIDSIDVDHITPGKFEF